MYQSKLRIVLYVKKNISGIFKSWRKDNASLFQTDKKHLGVNAAILSRCLELISFKIVNIISVTYSLHLASALQTHCKMEPVPQNNKNISETQAGKAQ